MFFGGGVREGIWEVSRMALGRKLDCNLQYRHVQPQRLLFSDNYRPSHGLFELCVPLDNVTVVKPSQQRQQLLVSSLLPFFIHSLFLNRPSSTLYLCVSLTTQNDLIPTSSASTRRPSILISFSDFELKTAGGRVFIVLR